MTWSHFLGYTRLYMFLFTNTNELVSYYCHRNVVNLIIHFLPKKYYIQTKCPKYIVSWLTTCECKAFQIIWRLLLTTILVQWTVRDCEGYCHYYQGQWPSLNDCLSTTWQRRTTLKNNIFNLFELCALFVACHVLFNLTDYDTFHKLVIFSTNISVFVLKK